MEERPLLPNSRFYAFQRRSAKLSDIYGSNFLASYFVIIMVKLARQLEACPALFITR